jgi:hypothetical protein
LEKEPDGRGSFLEEACANDEELRKEVESLLASKNQGQQFLERPALQVIASDLVDELPSLVGQQLGPYQILIMRLLGAGGMGIACRAEIRSGHTVGVKFLVKEMVQDR